MGGNRRAFRGRILCRNELRRQLVC
jgi:hypothetical protein